jgi:hypothetical protein
MVHSCYAFVGGNKNDAADARVIWMAVQQTGVKEVEDKTEGQQAVLALHRMRQQLVKACKAIAEVPGVGLLTATAAVATMGNSHAFKSGRKFAPHGWDWYQANQARVSRSIIGHQQAWRYLCAHAPDPRRPIGADACEGSERVAAGNQQTPIAKRGGSDHGQQDGHDRQYNRAHVSARPA